MKFGDMHLTNQLRRCILWTKLYLNKVNVMIPDDVYVRKAVAFLSLTFLEVCSE